MSEIDLSALRHHGDVELRPGMTDFAVNVRGRSPASLVRDRLAARLADLHSYPSSTDVERAHESVARRHGVDPAEVLLLAGSAEGFHLLATHAARHSMTAAVIHPSFTEPELELRRAGVPVSRVVLPPPFRFDPDLVPPEADMVVVGNPTNPTSVLHPRHLLAALCRPGRLTVVDEAFCDVVEDESGHTLAGAGLPGLVVLRSLTKTWGLAGLRAGYAVGDAEVLGELAAHRPHWPLGTLQLEALVCCTEPRAEADLDRIVADICVERREMMRALVAAGIEIAAPPSGPFLLVRTPNGVDPTAFRRLLSDQLVAVRRCDTFPGLDAGYLRLAVRGGTMVDELLRAWTHAVRELRAPCAGPGH